MIDFSFSPRIPPQYAFMKRKITCPSPNKPVILPVKQTVQYLPGTDLDHDPPTGSD